MLLITPRLRYRLPEHPDELFKIETDIFHNAWILEEQTEFYEWSVLMLTNEKIVRIVRYVNKHALREEVRNNNQLRDTVHGEAMIQIWSVNNLHQLKKIELYEGRMLDLEFEDSREILQINDTRSAESIRDQISRIHQDILEEKAEVSTEN